MSGDAFSPGGGAFAMRARTKPPSALAATATLAWRAMLKIKHVPFQLFDHRRMEKKFFIQFARP